MTTRESVERVLEGLRQGFRADGSDLIVEKVTDSTLILRLVGNDDTCWDCIVPPEQLKHVVSALLRSKLPAITHVELLDPRDETMP